MSGVCVSALRSFQGNAQCSQVVGMSSCSPKAPSLSATLCVRALVDQAVLGWVRSGARTGPQAEDRGCHGMQAWRGTEGLRVVGCHAYALALTTETQAAGAGWLAFQMAIWFCRLAHKVRHIPGRTVGMW